MNRRNFLTTTAGAALSARYAQPFADQKQRRVGLIGSGWYGKCDLLRLIQVSPVEVVSLCDADQRMVAERRRPGGHPPGVEEETPDVH